MYQFDKNDIITFRKSRFLRNFSLIYEDIDLYSDSEALYHINKKAKKCLDQDSSPAKLLSLYPMSYFCDTVSEEISIMEKEEAIKSLSLNMKEIDESLTRYHNDIKKFIHTEYSLVSTEYRAESLSVYNEITKSIKNCKETLQKRLQKIKKLNVLQDIADRDLFLKSSKSLEDPAWWTWLHQSVEMSHYITSSIIRANYPELKIYVCSTQTHTFLSNSDDISVIKNLCSSIKFTKDVSKPVIFDMINQVYIEGGRNLSKLYEGEIEVLSFKESITKRYALDNKILKLIDDIVDI